MSESVSNFRALYSQGEINRTMADRIVELERRLARLEAGEQTVSQAGTWTPSDASGAGLILSVGTATYVKTGRLVVAMFALTYPATASGATMRIGGLPFACESTGWNAWPVLLSVQQYGNVLHGLVDDNATTMRFTNSTGVVITNAAYSGLQIRGAAIYRTA